MIIKGKKRLCKIQQSSDNHSTASDISFEESENLVISPEISNKSNDVAHANVKNEILISILQNDDSIRLCKLFFCNFKESMNMKRKRSKASKTDNLTTSLVDLVNFSALKGSYKCLHLMLTLQQMNSNQKVDHISNALNEWIKKYDLDDGIRNIDDYDWGLNEPALSNVILDISPPGLQFIRGLLSGKFLPTDHSPLLIAIQNHQLNICKLVCEMCPMHALLVLQSPLPDETVEEEEVVAGVSVLFSLVHEHDDVTLTTCLLAIDQSLSNIGNIKPNIASASCSFPLRDARTLALIRSRNTEDQSTILHWAVEEGYTPFVTALLNLDISLIDMSDTQGIRPLHSSCMMDKAEITTLLLDRGARPLALDNKNWSAFTYALYSSSIDCAMALLKRSDDEALAYISSLGYALNGRQADARLDEVLESLATVPEFHRLLNDLLRKQPDLMIGGGRLSFVEEFPFLLDLHNKLIFANASLTSLSRQAVGAMDRLPILHTHYPSVRIALTRDSPWDSLVQVLRGDRSVGGKLQDRELEELLSPSYKAQLILRSGVILQFIESGTETGVGFGVEREVLGGISRDLTAPRSTDKKEEKGHNSSPLFVTAGDADDVYIPSPLSTDNSSTFEYFGYFVGHLLLRKIANTSAFSSQQSQDLLTFNVAPVFWKLVLQDFSLTVEDLAGFDAMLYQSLRYLLDNPNADELCLTFTMMEETASAATSSAGAVQMELVKGGQRRRVTDRNKGKYVNLLLEKKLLDRMKPQAELIRQGIEAVLPAKCLEKFSASEIGQLLEGTADVDVQDWQEHTVYQGWDTSTSRHTATGKSVSTDSPVLRWFWDLVMSLDRDKRGLLLRFCTGCSRVPAGGFQCLSPPFTITRVLMDQRRSLPTASTCFNLLKLPEYPTQAQLRRSTMTAVLLGNEGFSFT